jgi:hypothetical protein
MTEQQQNLRPYEGRDWTMASGTSLMGAVDVSYAELVAAFGPPRDGDGEKVDAEWILLTPDNKVVTIYNYKSGRNYDPHHGQDTEDIRDWHIGGRDPSVVALVERALANAAEARPQRQVTVTATLEFIYDLDDELVDSPGAALEDVKEMIAAGDLTVDQFDFDVTLRQFGVTGDLERQPEEERRPEEGGAMTIFCDDDSPEHVHDDDRCCECGGPHCCSSSRCPVAPSHLLAAQAGGFGAGAAADAVAGDGDGAGEGDPD